MKWSCKCKRVFCNEETEVYSNCPISARYKGNGKVLPILKIDVGQWLRDRAVKAMVAE